MNINFITKLYEQAIAEAKLQEGITPIRYDYDYQRYDPIFHPISHIHIGHNNGVRIGISKILFTTKNLYFFVIRNILL